jgi:hypothetical protein
MSNLYNHPAASGPDQVLGDCEVRRVRRSGPGGQHRNKVETAISLQHLLTGVRAEANERRSQAQNKTLAVFRLRVNLALEVRRPCSEAYAPSDLWRSRCVGKLTVSATSDDFPSLLAEALDVLAAFNADPKMAAAALGCTPSQLIRLLKTDPRALASVNRWRRELQMHSLQ